MIVVALGRGYDRKSRKGSATQTPAVVESLVIAMQGPSQPLAHWLDAMGDRSQKWQQGIFQTSGLLFGRLLLLGRAFGSATVVAVGGLAGDRLIAFPTTRLLGEIGRLLGQ